MNHLIIVGAVPDSRRRSLEAAEHHAALTALARRTPPHPARARGQRRTAQP